MRTARWRSGCTPDTAADGGDVARFRRVTEAYNLLSNRERRRAYDLQLANARAQARRVGGLGRPHPPATARGDGSWTVVHFDLGGRPGTFSGGTRINLD